MVALLGGLVECCHGTERGFGSVPAAGDAVVVPSSETLMNHFQDCFTGAQLGDQSLWPWH